MVANPSHVTRPPQTNHELNRIFSAQQAAYAADPYPSAAVRRDRLARLAKAVRNAADELVEAVAADFGHRAHSETLTAEIMVTLEGIRYARRRVRRWMRPSRRHVGLLMATTRAHVHYQPKGVVGIVSPWNYPIAMATVPLIYALAAGNRALLKPAEATPRTSATLARLVAGVFDETEVAVIEGDVETGIAFTHLAFDHLLFTGSTGVGRHVMRAAAEHLTAVTLELGGKSPTLIDRRTSMTMATERIAFGKALNAGQTCVAPDYVLCPRDRVETFVDAMREQIAQLYPTVAGNDDYTAIVNDHHYDRLADMLEDARSRGARVVPLSDGDAAALAAERRIPLTLLLDVDESMQVMQEEIFGPLLPVVPYDELDEAIAFIRARPRALAMNAFVAGAADRERLLRETHSGGVCFNDTIFHVAIDDLPFGGVGDSGFGNYHGREGFVTFSHERAVFARPRLNTAKLLYPPYGNWIQRAIVRLFLR